MNSLSSVSALLARLESIPHAARWKEMVQVGRMSVTPPDDATMQPIVVALAKSEVHYERLLAAMSIRGATAARNPLPTALAEACRSLFLDPSSTIHRIVQQPLVRTSSDEVLLQLLKTCPIRQFRTLVKALAVTGRSAVLHTLLTQVSGASKAASSFPADRLAILLTYMPSDALAALTTEEWDALTPSAVRELCLREPAMVVDHLTKAVKTACEGDTPSVMPRALEATVLTALAALSDPKNQSAGATDLAVRLMEGTLHHVTIGDYWRRQEVGRLGKWMLSRAPLPAIHYLLSKASVFKGSVTFRLSQRVREIATSDPKLVERMNDAGIFGGFTRNISAIFASLPTETRTYFWKTHASVFFERNGVLPSNIVSHLTTAKEREALAEQMYNHKALLDQPLARLPYLAVLPFAKAKELAQPFITDPTPDIRAATVAPLVQTAMYHSEGFGAVLDHFLLRKKENDPYRREVFTHLAQLPVSVWTRDGQVKSHTAKLAQLVQAALDAKDISGATLLYARMTLTRVILYDSEVISPVLVSVVKPYRSLQQPRDIRKASAEVVDLLVEALVPLFLEEMKTHSCQSMAAVMFNAFPNVHVRRLWATHFKVLADACLADTRAAAVSYGLDMYQQYSRSTDYVPLVRSLLAKEKDAILLDTSNMVVALLEQGVLLDEALQPVDNDALVGRFREDATHGNPLYYITFDTARYSRLWTARQQNAYAKTLTEALETYYADDYAQAATILRAVGKMPSVDVGQNLAKFAQLEYDNERTRAITITVMGKMMDKESMKELLAALNDARVGDAAVAIQSRLRGWTSASVVDLLQPLLFSTQAVGVQKQLVRFLGSYGDECAYQCLSEFRSSKPTAKEMHADVRVALVAAYYPFLNRKEVWDFYDDIATSSRAADVIALLGIPDSLLREQWQLARMNELVLVALRHAELRVQSEALTRLKSTPIRLEDARIYEVLLANLSRSKEGNIQSQSLSCIFEFRSMPVDQAARAIAALEDDADLSSCVNVVTSAARMGGESASLARVHETAALLFQLLLASRRQASLMVSLIIKASPLSTWVDRLTKLIDAGLMHPGAQGLLLENVREVTYRELNATKALEKSTLRSHPHALLRRMGLCILEYVGPRFSWQPDQVAGIKQYRMDADAWVHDDARLVKCKDENDE